jgi:glutamate racemase
MDDPYITEIAARYGPDCCLLTRAAPELVEFIENGGDTADAEEQRRLAASYIEDFRRQGADALVLGCTHFLLLLDVFEALAAPDISIYHSVEGVNNRIESILDKDHLRVSPAFQPLTHQSPDHQSLTGPPKKLLLLTDAAPVGSLWQTRAAALGFTISLIDGTAPRWGDKT